MENLLEVSQALVADMSFKKKRYLYDEIDWSTRLIGIKGARGTGKTTLALQYLGEQELLPTEGVYFSLDDLYFRANTLFDTATTFYKRGGKVIVLDEVHKYPGWSREIKNLYDYYKDLKVIFTGSSIIDISKEEGDLSRRALIYELAGLSYREYLEFSDIVSISSISLQDLINKKFSLRSLFPKEFQPLKYFETYLQTGYYPIVFEDLKNYNRRLKQLINVIVQIDMAELKGFDVRHAHKMLQLLYVISKQVPFKPNLAKLAAKVDLHRNSIGAYLHFLHEARLIARLYPDGISIATLQKPDKIYLDNTNLVYAISDNQPERGNVRETFFLNQLLVRHKVHSHQTADFLIDHQYVFEIGGKRKGRKQIEQVEQSWIVKDDLEYTVDRSIPLWAFGFLY